MLKYQKSSPKFLEQLISKVSCIKLSHLNRIGEPTISFLLHKPIKKDEIEEILLQKPFHTRLLGSKRGETFTISKKRVKKWKRGCQQEIYTPKFHILWKIQSLSILFGERQKKRIWKLERRHQKAVGIPKKALKVIKLDKI